MKILSSVALKNLKGEDFMNGDEVLTTGKALSSILLTAKKGGQMKLSLWAQDLYNEKEVTVDKADLGIIKSAIEGADPEKFNNLVTGQLLMILDDLKEGDKKAE